MLSQDFLKRLSGLEVCLILLWELFSFMKERKLKNILAYLNLFVNPEDEVSLLRVINIPKRGIGAVAINNINEASIKNGVCLSDIA